MILYLASLGILLAGILFLGIYAMAYAIAAPRMRQHRHINSWGPAIAMLACSAGFAGALMGDWSFAAPAHVIRLPWGLPFGRLELAMDPLSRIFLLPVFGLGFVCAWSGALALRHEKASNHNLASHWFFYLLLVFGMAVVICAHDAILFLLAWELMSLAPFFLIDFNDSDSQVRDAAWIYLVAAHLGAVFLIGFFGLLWTVTGQTSLSPSMAGHALDQASPFVAGCMFTMAVIGFGAKAGITPLHVWLPEAHPAAPSHISALLSGAMINAGLYGLLRSIQLLASPSGSFGCPLWWGWTILLIGLLTAVVGILKALGQSNLKRLLAYSSVENMGLMFIGAGCGLIGINCHNGWIAFLGFAGCIMHMLNHAGFKGLLFLCAGEVLHSAGTVQMDLLGGLQKHMPVTGSLFALGAASIACLPPFGGFASEFAICLGLANGAQATGVENQLGLLLCLGALALVSGLACALYVKAYGMTFLGMARSGFAANAHSLPMRQIHPLIIPALACIAGGLLAPMFFMGAANAVLGWAPLAQDLFAECHQVMKDIAPAWQYISAFGCLLGIMAFFIWLVRAWLLRDGGLFIHKTWGCGYQASSSRIQYTPASFVEPLARIFGPVMGHITRDGSPGNVYYPDGGRLDVSAPDRIRLHIFTPLFESVEYACNACKIIQHGKIHIYILYILASVVGLLVWGLWS